MICDYAKRLVNASVDRTHGGILTGVAGSAPEGVCVPRGGIELPCEYVLYGAKKDREIVGQTLQKVQKSENRKEKTELRTYVCPTVYCLVV